MRLDEETKAALVGLSQSVADLALAVQGLNSNHQALYTNLRRLSERLAIHEAATALNEMMEGETQRRTN